MEQNLLELHGITKRFPGIVACDSVDLTVGPGTIRGLVGENGAGKTTLMRIVFGIYQPDAGQILLRGSEVRFQNPRDAMAAGISMVHQQSMLVPTMSVLENVLLAKPRGSLLKPRELHEELRAVMDRYHVQLDLTRPAESLSVAERQRAEILKALYCESELIILDEPTTVLTPHESTLLFESLRALSSQGKAIILITHRLPEVKAVTDDVTVLRAGRIITTEKTADLTETQIARHMVGRDIKLRRTRMEEGREERGRDSALTVGNLSVRDDQGYVRVKGVSFDILRGEIVGIAAVQGNGQAELVEALFGLRPRSAGGSCSTEGTSPAFRRAEGDGWGCITFPGKGSGSGSTVMPRCSKTSSWVAILWSLFPAPASSAGVRSCAIRRKGSASSA